MRIVRTVAGGAVAGAIATAAMDLLWYRRYRRDGGDNDLATWEFSTSVTGYDDDDVPAPAQVGQRVARAVGVDLDDSTVAAANSVVHWATGVGWGQFAGLAAAIVPAPALGVGIASRNVWAA